MKNQSDNHKHPLVTVVIPTFNSGTHISLCLESVKRQKHSFFNTEIIVCDGGSDDNTVSIAKKFGCILLNNPKRLAEFGVMLGINNAHGDFITVIAVDNEFRNEYCLERMISPFFENSQIAVTYPMHVSDKKDYWISEYINTFTDPVNHFIFGNASNTRTFSRVYRTEYSSSEYVIYRFDARNYPMLALAQGTTIRKKYFNKIDSTGDDLYPIIKLIEKGYQFAYVPKAQIIHHTVNNINQFIKKQKWAVDNFLEGRQYGINNRSGFQNSGRKLRLKLWPLYAGSIILPVFISTLGLVSERKKAWIYHPILTYIILSICITEFIRIRIIRVSPEINRNL